jgi:superfamily II DNA or RNA helicase
VREWKLQLTPREWQTVALQRWKPELRGIIRVVTGGGKTVFAQQCLLEFFQRYPAGQVLVIVPTISLLDQWCVALQEELLVAADVP